VDRDDDKLYRCVGRRAGRGEGGALYDVVVASKAEASEPEARAYRNELGHLKALSHKLIANLYAAIDTPTDVVWLTEFCPGGDLLSQLLRHPQPFLLDDVRVLVAQMLLPLEHLHNNCSLMHRNLNLESLMVGRSGALKLSGFSYAKSCKEKSHTVCGKMLYLAPEMILEMGHGPPVDHWALGVCAYELLMRSNPFDVTGASPLETMERIQMVQVDYGAMDATAKELISNLLQRDLSRRYGNLLGGASQIKQHAFFAPLFDRQADVVGQFNALADKSGVASLSVPEFYSSEGEWDKLESMQGVLSDTMPTEQEQSFFVGI